MLAGFADLRSLDLKDVEQLCSLQSADTSRPLRWPYYGNWCEAVRDAEPYLDLAFSTL